MVLRKQLRNAKDAALPYHGAEPVHHAVREIIAGLAEGDKMPMSGRRMVKYLEKNKGLEPDMARRFFSQIRKGGKLHEEWKEAFHRGKFMFQMVDRRLLKQQRIKETELREASGGSRASPKDCSTNVDEGSRIPTTTTNSNYGAPSNGPLGGTSAARLHVLQNKQPPGALKNSPPPIAPH